MPILCANAEPLQWNYSHLALSRRQTIPHHCQAIEIDWRPSQQLLAVLDFSSEDPTINSDMGPGGKQITMPAQACCNKSGHRLSKIDFRGCLHPDTAAHIVQSSTKAFVWCHTMAIRRQSKIAPCIGQLPALPIAPPSIHQVAGAVWNWTQCAVILVLMLSQLLTIVKSDSSEIVIGIFGRPPAVGTYAIGGYNDEPYSDRALVCSRRMRRFKVLSVNEALVDSSTVIESADGSAVNGYRVVNRTGLVIEPNTRLAYAKTCSLINRTLEHIFSACGSLGYTNLTHDSLRIMNDKTLARIPGSLPIIIMPYWDNNPSARFAIPGWSGHACMFHLDGMYQHPELPVAYMYGVNRTVRESKTVEWLQKSGGAWKNGWYEDLEGEHWYSDVISTNPDSSEELSARWFDPVVQRELNCSNPGVCADQIVARQWGASLQIHLKVYWGKLVAVSNGNRYGLFYYEYKGKNIVSCVYDMATFISNASVILLIARWMLNMYALQRGYWMGITPWYNAGIGSLANSYSFNILPLAMLPRLKSILAAFYTIGCEFEGDQKALSDSWFVMYPAIVGIVLIASSLINLSAKVFRRRMSDWTVTPSIVLLSVMHYLRAQIARSKWFGFDGRLATILSPAEFNQASVLYLFTSEGAIRMSGNISSLLVLKLVVLGLNVLPLLFSANMSIRSKLSRMHKSCDIEKAVAIRACNVGGIGFSSLYASLPCENGPKKKHQAMFLSAYELVRLGYIVVGGQFLMTWDNWLIMTSASPLRRIYGFWNYRILAFKVHTGNSCDGVYRVSSQAEMLRLNDNRLQRITFWDVDTRPFE